MADLSAYLDGELSPERARQVEQFVAESEEARRTLADLRAISKALSDLPRMRAPANLPDEIRRSAERQVLLQDRAPPGRARVLRLFARISASAALIAVCTFVGWTVLHRITPEIPSGVGSEPVLRRGGVAKDDARETFAKGTRADEVAEPPAEGIGVAESVPQAPAIAMADKLEAGDKFEMPARGGRLAPPSARELVQDLDGAPAEEGERFAAKDQAPLTEAGAPAAGPTMVMDAAPEVNVVVQPRDTNEYNASLQIVAFWQQPSPAIAGEPVVGRVARGAAGVGRRIPPADTAAGAGYEFGMPTQQDFKLEVPANQVGDVLLALERKAPQQVQVEMRFNVSDYARVQQIVMSGGAATPATGLQLAQEQPPVPESASALVRADSPGQEKGPALARPDALQAGRFGGVTEGRGRVVRTPSRSETTEPAEAQEAEDDQRIAAYRVGETRDAEAVQPLARSGHAGDSVVTDEAGEELTAVKEKGLDEQRQPRVEDVAAGVPARLASPAVRGELGVAEGSPIGADVAKSDEPSSAARQIGERAVEIREHLEQTYRAMFGTASELPKKPPEPTVPPAPPPPVTLRVTLLPPPAATRPGAQSRPSTADPDKP